MSRSSRRTRSSANRVTPRVEPLESRSLLTVSPGLDPFGIVPPVPVALSILNGSAADLSVLSVVSTDPQDGAVIPDSPAVINVTFNQAFDPTSVGFDFSL